ncbi:nicotinamide riboside transporter PnuC [Pseudoalteromonas byunsanensis]|uniref:Nicotinamide riboside transporter PnuC n=1 Tax=Pseudoalteromonas byunsanensis TaxID=327939 RepID=A0A1S1NCA7_9GAMM|nr:nicotinamide riboside transporter PnuC [Pseudoalteromonas byunsanensis]OHU97772.1 nicotinamide mononucleotide transporter [Pseudoalteromonas byunsanensis]
MLDTLWLLFSILVALPYWEYCAVFLGLIYLFLAIKEHNGCWMFGFLSTFMYALMYWQGELFVESLLHGYYMLMAFVGWWMWRQGFKSSKLPICSWPVKYHALITILTIFVSIIAALLAKKVGYHTPVIYIDSLSVFFSIVATYLLVNKVLENWLYWIVINTATMYLFLVKGYYATLVLSVVYTLMACWGYKYWYESYEQRRGKSLGNL